MMTLRKFIGIITGSRRRRWARALAIHESHRQDGEERSAVDEAILARVEAWFPRTLGDKEAAAERLKAACFRIECLRIKRTMIGSRWLGPRPTAP